MSINFEGTYYSGQNSEKVDTLISVDEFGLLHLSAVDLDGTKIPDLTISPRVGNSTRYLHFPNGASIETRCNDEVDQFIKRWGMPGAGKLHRLERSVQMAVIAIVLLVGGTYLFVTQGIPALSSTIVDALPTSLDDRLGGEVLDQLDQLFFSESLVSEDRQEVLLDLFYTLIPEDKRDYQLQFRSSDFIGANAFALPDATIVFTDQLIELTDDDEMLAAIMLHEIGHVKERHSMQAVVRQAGISILIVTLTGDVNTAATTLLVLFPSFLIQSQYSQNLEWAADSYALEQMLARGMDTNAFAEMMERLVASNRDAEADQAEEEPEIETDLLEDDAIAQDEITEDEGGMFEYFSSHPATQSRIERFRNAAR